MLETNHVPILDMKTSTTGCCPQFDVKAWDNQTITLENKNFVKASVRSFMYMPLNIGKVMTNTWAAIEAAGAKDPKEFMVMSQDVSPWKADYYFWTTKDVAGQHNVRMTGKYVTKVFEGPYKDAKTWYEQTLALGVEKSGGNPPKNIYLYYTTCPKCAKVYGKNYVVGLAQIS